MNIRDYVVDRNPYNVCLS